MILANRLEPKLLKKKWDIRERETAYDHLTNYMKNHKPYLSSEVSLNSLAQKLSVPPHYLSRLIKEVENKSFLEFINQHRIEAVKHLITSPEMQHYTLEAIGQEAGFANKMSLSRAFRKHCGMTPSEYRNKKLQGN
jgi:YesN/AraC family two-component response regulator